MDCLQLSMLPLPQLIMVKQCFREPGWKYNRRNDSVFILLFCKKGIIHITEGQTAYTLHPGELIVLDPAREQYGHLKSEQELEYYYIYFLHSPTVRYVADTQIDWGTFIRPGVKWDLLPPGGQFMFLPKFSKFNPNVIIPILDEMIQIHRMLNLENALKLHELLLHLLNLLHLSVLPNKSTRTYTISEDLKKYIFTHYKQPVQTRDLEENLHFQYDYLCRCLKRHTGMTPMQYLLHVRLNEACHQLALGELSLSEIADEVGIHDYNYFSRVFHKSFGMSPKAYRRLHLPQHRYI